MDEHDEQRLKNKVEDIEKFYIPVIKELKEAMTKAKKLGFLGLIVGAASLGVSGYLALKIWDKGW
mgnify:FL=1|jgi:hypothetical protein|tara:strand:- start:511 stop:705 length:195 start_codon:yes stop_codon:yes gene_type:complete